MFQLILLAVALVVAIAGLRRMAESAEWTPTKAVIQSAEIVSLSRDQKRNYQLDISYTYEVEGKTYTGDVLMAGVPGLFDRQNEAQEWLDKYPAGKTVEAFYNPNAPKEACLISTKGYSGKLLLLGALVLAVAIVLIVIMSRLAQGQIGPAMETDW